MKRKMVTGIALGCILLLSIAFKIADDIISRLGMEHNGAQYHILNYVVADFDEDDNTNFRIPYARLLPDIIKGDKVGAAKELCVYIKNYINSQEFIDTYNKKREEAKPTSEPWRPDAEQIKELRNNVKQMEKDIAKMKANKNIPAATLAAVDKGLADQKAMLADWEDPTPNKTKWEKLYPADPAKIVKGRLEEYLKLVATIDFNAQLTEPDKYKKRKFVNPVYEKETHQWKACFRAGKEVNDAVTVFVKDWLKGEIIASTKIKMITSSSPGATTPSANGNSNNTATTTTEKKDEPVKEKKSLFKKLKDKVNNEPLP